MPSSQGSGGPKRSSRHVPGERIGQYILIESRGSGGMGEVWEAQAADGQIVALKLMHEHWADDLSMVARFRREFDVGYKIRHPNLVQMIAYEPRHHPPYLVMQLAPGKSLRRLIEKGGPFRESEVAVIGAQIGDALAALHRNGVVHRDLKSSNIMVERGLRTLIIDFGIAKIDGEVTLTSSNSFIGSAEYSSPEPYLAKPAVARSDVYSAGIVLYEALVGRVPFRSDRYTDTLRMQAEYPVPRVTERNPAISAEMDRLVTSALQKQPERRPNAEQFAAACRAIADMHGAVLPGSAPARPRQEIVPAPAPEAPAPIPPAYPEQDGLPPEPLYQPSQPPVGIFVAVGAAAAMIVGIVLALAGGG